MKTSILFSITDIERETGISRDTLRIWERRYGFPTPLRNQRSERTYTEPQLSRLRLLKQLLDRGLRPGKIIRLDDRELRRLTVQPPASSQDSVNTEKLLEILTRGPRYDLPARLEAQLQQLGLRRFLTGVIAPLNRAVGEAWFNGKIGIFDEHYYSEQVRRVLTSALSSLPSGDENLRVLLTTLPGEPHSIGLLMVACMLGLEGAQVLLVGTQTPLDEIVRGAVECSCCIVGISCSAYMGNRTIASQMVKLRKMLPSRITLWAGGSGVSSLTFLQNNIRLFTDLNQVSDAIQALHIQKPSVVSNGLPLPPGAAPHDKEQQP